MAEPTSETQVIDLLTSMTGETVLATSLDERTMMMVRIAALVAIDAPAFSYQMNLEAAAETGIGATELRGLLTAVAPIVGTARVMSATGKIAEVIEVEIDRQLGSS
jgi:alkylhydroperoxidase/carboxymuconolactone decarboxylase family protein YurZ